MTDYEGIVQKLRNPWDSGGISGEAADAIEALLKESGTFRQAALIIQRENNVLRAERDVALDRIQRARAVIDGEVLQQCQEGSPIALVMVPAGAIEAALGLEGEHQ